MVGDNKLRITSNDKSKIIVDLSKSKTLLSEKLLAKFALFNRSDILLYPILILCDDLKSTEEIFAYLASDHNYDRKKILLVKNKNGVNADILWGIISNGIHDILEWTSEEDIINYLQSLKKRRDKIDEIVNSPVVKKHLIGESRVWKLFLSQIIEAALFTQSPILLIGESGSGKELISRLIHTIDTRHNKKDLILLDCTTIISDLSGSEFFGHEKGSYTNALQAREGAFALANNGTLFLDEIGELPIHLQPELLRVIQEGTFKKIGSNTWQKTNFRLISATHKDIKSMSLNGGFRPDLYFRMSDFEFKLPSLKDRKEDIILLAKHFFKEFFTADKVPDLDDQVVEYLMNREYPGNIRDLKQLIRRISLNHLDHRKITIGEIALQDRPAREIPQQACSDFNIDLRDAILSGHTLRDLKNQTMLNAINVTIDICHGDKTMAAKKLGVTLRAMQQFWKKNKVVLSLLPNFDIFCMINLFY